MCKPFLLPDNEWFISFKTSSCPTKQSRLQLSLTSFSPFSFSPLLCSSKFLFSPTQKRKKFYFGPIWGQCVLQESLCLTKLPTGGESILNPSFIISCCEEQQLHAWGVFVDSCWFSSLLLSNLVWIIAPHVRFNWQQEETVKKGVLHRKDKLVIHTDKEWHYKYNDVFGSNPKQSFCVVSYTESTCEESNGCYVSKHPKIVQKKLCLGLCCETWDFFFLPCCLKSLESTHHNLVCNFI